MSNGYGNTGAYIRKLSGVGNIIFIPKRSKLYDSQLYVDDLFYSIYFDFNVVLAGKDGGYLFH